VDPKEAMVVQVEVKVGQVLGQVQDMDVEIALP
jgi:hypothetical protein